MPSPLDMALLGPSSADEAMDMAVAMPEEESDSDAEVVAADVFAAIEAKDAKALVRSLRDLLDVMNGAEDD